jgi:hypothetical protein
MTSNSVSRQDYLNNILDLAANTNSDNSQKAWAQYPTTSQRAQSLLNLRLKFYIQNNDTDAVADTQWAIKQVLKRRGK